MAKPGPKKRGPRSPTFALSLSKALAEAHEQLRGTQWPSAKYKDDPVGFVREVLCEAVILPHQVAILESARDNFKTAVRSGQKTGKTKTVIWLALWWYCTVPGGRVLMTAASKSQIVDVVWKELGRTVFGAKRRGFDFIEEIPVNPATGVHSPDGRDMVGKTVKDREAMAGFSGKILAIVDEASAMKQDIAEAVEGNLMATGCRMVWISNPTRTEGPFFDAFHDPKKTAAWSLFHVSSWDVAKYLDENGIKDTDLASYERVRSWRDQMGETDPFYIMRVLGEFLRNETGRVISTGDIEDAQLGWHELSDSSDELRLGIDPAGPGDGGDEWAFSLVRGKKHIGLYTKLGLTIDAAIEYARDLISVHRRGHETPKIMVDSDGPIGSEFTMRLRIIGEAVLAKDPSRGFEVYGVKSSLPARRKPMQYERVREELWANAAEWLRNGGCIISDHKLATELHAPMWDTRVNGKLAVTHKDELRERLGRSPDRADSLLLAIWEPQYAAAEVLGVPVRARHGAQTPSDLAAPSMNPYGSGMSGGRGGGFDPYRG